MEKQSIDTPAAQIDETDSPAMYQSLTAQPVQFPDPDESDAADSLLHPRPARAMFFPADDWDF